MKDTNWSPATRYFVAGVLLVAGGFLLWQIREIFAPLITAGLIAFLLYPVAAFLHQRFHLAPKLASNLVFFFSVAVIIFVPAMFAPTIGRELQGIAADLLKTLDDIGAFLSRPIVFGSMTIHLDALVPGLQNSLSNFLAPLPADAWLLIESTSRGTLWFLVIVVSAYYFMVDWDKLRDALIGLAPEPYQHDVRHLYLEIKKVWMAYLRGQITLMVIVAVVFSIVWSIIGLPGALVLGILAGLFSIIPDVGPAAATALALIVALLEGSTWMNVSHLVFGLIVAGLYVVLINIKNIWLRPYILGRSVHMHEGIVFIAIIAAVIFTGVIGAFVIVPVLASLAVIGRYLRARLLGLPPFMDEKHASTSAPRPAAAQGTDSLPAPKPVKKKRTK